ncbi:MAG: sigma-70 family RNA polymerase sigma factor [Bacteroidota bacterium]
MQEPEFLRLIEANRPRLERICRFYLKEIEARKDLMQEIVFQIWRSRERYRGDAHLNTWLYRIALNTALAYVRKNKKRFHESLAQVESIGSDANSPIEQLVRKNRKQRLIQAIKQLKSLDQTVVLLYLEELSYEEIAEVTGLTTTNVGAKISRIKKRLSTIIQRV